MCEIIEFNPNNKIIGRKYGSILISVYKTKSSDHSFFVIKPENEEVLEIADIIEDALKLY